MSRLSIAARRYRFLILTAALAVTLFAGVFAVAAATAQRSFHGTGPADTPVAILGSVAGGEGASLDVYAAPSPDPDDPASCTAKDHAVFDDYGYRRRLTHDGREWVRIGHLAEGWKAGQTVTCSGPGVEQILLTHDARGRWLVFAIGLGVGAPFLWIFALVVFLVARSARPTQA